MRATQLVIGEMIHRHSAPDVQLSIVVTLLTVKETLRARGEPRYLMQVVFTESEKYTSTDGYTVQSDDGGDYFVTVPEAYTYVKRYAASGLNTCTFFVDAAYGLGAVYTADRLAKLVAKVAALDPVVMRDKADAKELAISGWLTTERKVRALAAIQTLRDTADLVDLLRTP